MGGLINNSIDESGSLPLYFFVNSLYVNQVQIYLGRKSGLLRCSLLFATTFSKINKQLHLCIVVNFLGS